MLITVSGVDCSGKSTQIDLLARYLEGRGERVEVIWFRPGYSRTLDTARALVRRVRPSALPKATDSGARERAFQRPNLRRAWLAMALADMIAQYALRIRALRASGATVICDRYLLDAQLDLTLRFPELERRIDAACGAAERIVPRPDAAFLLMVDWPEALRRTEMKKEPFPDPLDVRRARHEAYARLAERGNMITIDAGPPIDEVHRALVDALERVRTR